jgi:pristinamycin I synthase-3/4
LTQLSRRTGTSLFMVLQAGLAMLLTRLGAGPDIPIGAPIAGRTDEALDDMVGFFVNTLVLRVDTSSNPTFAELLERVRDVDLNAFGNQDVPFDHLVEVLNPRRSLSRHPLVQVMLTMLEENGKTLLLPGVQSVSEPLELFFSRYDLWLGMSESRSSDGTCEGIHGELRYSSDLFDRSTMRSVAGRLVALLGDVASDPTLQLIPARGLAAVRRRPVRNASEADVRGSRGGDLTRPGVHPVEHERRT